MSLAQDYSDTLPRRQNLNRLSGDIALTLYALLTLFPVSYVYLGSLSALLSQLKWIPLLALFLLLLLRASKQRQVMVEKTPFHMFSALIVAAVFSSLLTPYGDASYSEVAMFGVVILTALLLTATIKRRQAEKHFFDIVLNVGRVIIAVSFVFAVLNINLGRGVGRFSGWSDNPNSLALILAPVLIVLYARTLEKQPGWKIRYLPFLLAGLYVLVLTGSRGGIGWVAVSLLVFPIARLNAHSRLLVFMAVVVVFVGFGDYITHHVFMLFARNNHGSEIVYNELLSGRAEAWEIGLRSIREHPLLGIGVGNERRLLQENSSLLVLHNGEHLHSSFISALVEIGFVGGSIMALIFFLAVTNGFKRARVMTARYSVSRPAALLPLALFFGALAHGAGETWFLKPGNANSLLFWFLVVYNTSKIGAPHVSARLPDGFAAGR